MKYILCCFYSWLSLAQYLITYFLSKQKRKQILRRLFLFLSSGLQEEFVQGKKYWQKQPPEVPPEATIRGVLWIKLFLEISQNLQENTCEFWKISKNTFFTEHLQTTASDMTLQNNGKFSLHIKLSVPFRVSSVNVTKSARYCGFGYIYWINL